MADMADSPLHFFDLTFCCTSLVASEIAFFYTSSKLNSSTVFCQIQYSINIVKSKYNCDAAHQKGDLAEATCVSFHHHDNGKCTIGLMQTFNQQTLSLLEDLFHETINKTTKNMANIDHYHGDEMRHT